MERKVYLSVMKCPKISSGEIVYFCCSRSDTIDQLEIMNFQSTTLFGHFQNLNFNYKYQTYKLQLN